MPRILRSGNERFTVKPNFVTFFFYKILVFHFQFCDQCLYKASLDEQKDIQMQLECLTIMVVEAEDEPRTRNSRSSFLIFTVISGIAVVEKCEHL